MMQLSIYCLSTLALHAVLLWCDIVSCSMHVILVIYMVSLVQVNEHNVSQNQPKPHSA